MLHPCYTRYTLQTGCTCRCIKGCYTRYTLKHEKLYIANIPWKYLFPNLLPLELFFVTLQHQTVFLHSKLFNSVWTM